MTTLRISISLHLSLLLCSVLGAQGWSWQKAAAAPARNIGGPASMASSPGLQNCLIARPGTINFWNGGTWRELGTFTTHEYDSGSVAYDDVRQCWIHTTPYVGTGGDGITRCIDANGSITALSVTGTKGQSGPIAYDAARGAVVGTSWGDTLLLGSRDVAWRTLSIPGPRGIIDDAAICYYPATKTVIWQGGFQGRGSTSETWEWNGQSWRKITTQRKPRPRLSGFLFLEPTSGLLFYGGGWSDGDLHDLWTFDGLEWKELTVLCPSDTQLVAAAYDYATKQPIAVDIRGRIWRLYQGQPATVEAFELQSYVCNGSPRLRVSSNGVPRLGSVFHTHTDSVPLNSAAIFLLGAVQPVNGGTGLHGTGNPACHLWLVPVIYSASLEQNGFAHSLLPIPNEARLLCQRFYQQAIVIDLAANALGLVTSNGLSCHIGL